MSEPIIITEDAAKEIANKIQKKEDVIGLRLTIKSTGCSGHSYSMEYVMEEDLSQDDKFEQGEAVLYIPKVHSWMLFGMEIGYEASQMHSGFTFTNPNEVGRCGCGESFTVERTEEN